MGKDYNSILNLLRSVCGNNNVITQNWRKYSYTNGWRFGKGDALAVVKPVNLTEIWNTLKVCVENNIIVIMQAANTGLTGGSTPNKKNYDRPIIIINTIRIKDIHVIKNGHQVIALGGSSLFDLENIIKPFGREPHSVIGSTSIGATVIGGICNNSGGSLVHRGPAFTELALYARVNEKRELELINELDINLGSNPEEILENLQSKNYVDNDIIFSDKCASDKDYSKIVREVDSKIPARYNSDKRLLFGASGSAGKIAVFAVRLDTYPAPKKKKVFYLGTNNPNDFSEIRREILKKFKNLPRLGDYLHRDCYITAQNYSKDSFLLIERLGTNFLPFLFSFKRIIDLMSSKIPFCSNNLSDRLMQFLGSLFPDHLPKKMNDFRDNFEHHWIIEMTDDGITEAKDYFIKYFKDKNADFFECNERESKKAMLHRYVSAGAFGRYFLMNEKKVGKMITIDVAFSRNHKDWFEKLPEKLNKLFIKKLYYGHLFCHVFHHNYILKKGVCPDETMSEILKIYDKIGAEYPAEHNVGHEYKAKPTLEKFYRDLDPTNFFNPGIGKTSKKINWK
ncbi:MAG: D-lactate dehydrogenase [Flavobacteriaceae bacterium]|tara:strand:+ start:40 stop:1734 length:1695 start_codon:yes stop_codon:yes gene_type:complete